MAVIFFGIPFQVKTLSKVSDQLNNFGLNNSKGQKQWSFLRLKLEHDIIKLTVLRPKQLWDTFSYLESFKLTFDHHKWQKKLFPN